MIKRDRGLKSHLHFFAVTTDFLSGLYLWTPLFENYRKDTGVTKNSEQDGKTA